MNENGYFAIINGPNLNRLGRRDPATYGTATLADILTAASGAAPDYGQRTFQSNCEGDIIDAIQQATDDSRCAGIIINPGAYAHYSHAIADAIRDAREAGRAVVEVHLSNIHAREEFRARSLTGAACNTIITGAGGYGYALARMALAHHLNEARKP
ncbi:MAG: 3-dehydroquinate dehydratase [Muribaculaceae bacterium]|nr:3-dehydroquinate dehydratase [Muribaculaceae bacterium]